MAYWQLKSLLHLGQNVITFRTFLHLGSFITFRPSTTLHFLDRRGTASHRHRNRAPQPFLCLNRSPIQYDFHGDATATPYGVNIALMCLIVSVFEVFVRREFSV